MMQISLHHTPAPSGLRAVNSLSLCKKLPLYTCTPEKTPPLLAGIDYRLHLCRRSNRFLSKRHHSSRRTVVPFFMRFGAEALKGQEISAPHAA
ncbi:hypothetical protein Barb4_01117 [Bacteroidales bacterium Barb4]|nr:hypothetical protein Barb4_01117 [Bacteroidales bacterium Barb4]